MKRLTLSLILAASFTCTPAIAFSSSKTCPDKVLGVDQIEGVYSGIEEGDFSWLVLDVEGEAMSLMAAPEELEATFGQNPEGKRIAVKYEVQQFWNEYGNECSRLNVFKSGKLVVSVPKPATSSKIEALFQPETLGSTIAYLEHMVGPARKINDDRREYVIDGCKVSIWGVSDIVAMELELSPQCTFDVSKFTGNETPVFAHEMTFGHLGGKITADCLYRCGNAFVPQVYSTYEGPRANGWIDIQAAAEVGRFVAPWEDAMLKAKGEDWVLEGKFNCDSEFQDLAVSTMKHVKAEKVKVGYELGEKCN